MSSDLMINKRLKDDVGDDDAENEKNLCETAQRIEDGLRRYYEWKGEKYQTLQCIKGMDCLYF